MKLKEGEGAILISLGMLVFTILAVIGLITVVGWIV